MTATWTVEAADEHDRVCPFGSGCLVRWAHITARVSKRDDDEED